MRNLILGASLALCALPLAPALAQVQPATIILDGTRLDVVATGEVSRVPDLARISAGVVAVAPSATAALAQNATQMASVRAALKRAGIADRDIQTSSINLHPDYRHDAQGSNPQIIGYRASNEVSVRFRDIAATGRILDALVAQGANHSPPMIMMRQAASGNAADSTSVDPGEQSVAVSLSVSFELE